MWSQRYVHSNVRSILQRCVIHTTIIEVRIKWLLFDCVTILQSQRCDHSGLWTIYTTEIEIQIKWLLLDCATEIWSHRYDHRDSWNTNQVVTSWQLNRKMITQIWFPRHLHIDMIKARYNPYCSYWNTNKVTSCWLCNRNMITEAWWQRYDHSEMWSISQ